MGNEPRRLLLLSSFAFFSLLQDFLIFLLFSKRGMCVPSNEDNGRSKSRRADGGSHAGKSRSLRASTHVYHLFVFRGRRREREARSLVTPDVWALSPGRVGHVQT